MHGWPPITSGDTSGQISKMTVLLKRGRRQRYHFISLQNMYFSFVWLTQVQKLQNALITFDK